jgi:hypothetical protein
MLSHAVMRVVQVFPSFLMLSLSCVFVRDGLPSIEMWIDPGEDRCYGLSKVGMVETVWISSGDVACHARICYGMNLRSRPPGRHVPPRVPYGMAVLLIRYAICCVSCSVEWGWLLSVWHVFVTFFMNCLNHMVQKGPLCAGNLSTASGATLCGNP